MSPTFPVGSYAYSHGLEQVVVDGDITTADNLAEWLNDILWMGAGRTDGLLLAAAHRGEDAHALSDKARALAASKERWEETIAQGRAFSEAVTGATGVPLDPMPYPVAVGVAARQLSLPTAEVVKLFLHATMSNLVSAAVRFVPLGQADGQRVLAGLHGAMAEVAEMVALTPVDEIASFVPGGDLAAMRHEELEVRIFRT
ncbi:urease accessory UreF family protein [Pseudoruegeria sp. HB172150]|uniref:urease accessory protein UreF n=1 Tax=Pseudoruegeria sp. HB172150 TaxID=2721164 RepID=UPI001557EBD7